MGATSTSLIVERGAPAIKAECLGGPEIDDKLEMGRYLKLCRYYGVLPRRARSSAICGSLCSTAKRKSVAATIIRRRVVPPEAILYLALSDNSPKPPRSQIEFSEIRHWMN
jgi:hypothetical protein